MKLDDYRHRKLHMIRYALSLHNKMIHGSLGGGGEQQGEASGGGGENKRGVERIFHTELRRYTLEPR